MRIPPLSTIWYNLRTNFWFIPMVMLVAAVIMSQGALALDAWLLSAAPDFKLPSLFFTGSPDGARALLSTVAGSMVTVASVTFSITVLTFTLTITNMGPRLLDNFISDRRNQFALGVFISVFVYSLLILNSDQLEFPPMPAISVALALVGAIGGFVVLISFVHHVAKSIKVDRVISLVEGDLLRTMDTLFPENMGKEPGEEETEGLLREDPIPAGLVTTIIHAPASGYLVDVDSSGLMGWAVDEDVILRLYPRPGDFLVEGNEMARAYGREVLTDEAKRSLHSDLFIGFTRTPPQDLELSINQLVEIALRALSPGINDTFTALSCIDRLGSALSRLSRRAMPSPYRFDDEGKLRVIAKATGFESAAQAAFNLIRQSAGGNVGVLMRLLESLDAVARGATRYRDLQVLQLQAEMVLAQAEALVKEPQDLKDVKALHLKAQRHMKQAIAALPNGGGEG